MFQCLIPAFFERGSVSFGETPVPWEKMSSTLLLPEQPANRSTFLRTLSPANAGLSLRPSTHRWVRGNSCRLSDASSMTNVRAGTPVLWGAPRIHGELLKLGFAVAQPTVAKYMAKIDGSPSGQSWGTFLRNHMPHIAAMDLFVVPTIGFNLLYVLVIVRLARRKLVWINVTAHPTAEWIAQQITEAFPWS